MITLPYISAKAAKSRASVVSARNFAVAAATESSGSSLMRAIQAPQSSSASPAAAAAAAAGDRGAVLAAAAGCGELRVECGVPVEGVGGETARLTCGLLCGVECVRVSALMFHASVDRAYATADMELAAAFVEEDDDGGAARRAADVLVAGVA